ncbi:MAG: SDR family NAD(P)-dependent oxidoreductase [Brevibacterium sp.]|nr:SDR family NAD(P)-dependent oxidoreductase [Brevibacterium sp.]MDN5910704.1 SDR family NAD(P)-dependent oxidoreductase [Brevibacterium sp.]MDN6134575.1 SDR family NAD(P)-dependent oxidoreductase [Brevibacterium sp.]MDN6159240.1 SDR family NAD(P)-dependent oxidoreductase [Brevibacterium sp.]MDN6189364.1 SDR family NAD(P)-dependent oxidoreductase [Brevibacterium sp.]
MTRPRALITGASSGLGRGYTLSLAADQYDLVLVARDEARLQELARSIETEHGTLAEVVVADLSTRSGIDVVRTVIETSRVDLLINNAGYGLKQSLLESEVSDLVDQDMVLTGAVRELSLAAVKQMRNRGRGGLINVSSMAALTTMGQYAAAKMSTLVFTEALAGELRGSPVTVTAVLPGFIRTRFHERLGVERPGPGWIWLSVAQVVAASLRDARGGKVVSIPGVSYRMAARIARFVPRPLVRWGSNGFSLNRRDG